MGVSVKYLLSAVIVLNLAGCELLKSAGGEEFTNPDIITEAESYGSAAACSDGEDVCVEEPDAQRRFIASNNGTDYVYIWVDISSSSLESDYSFPLRNLEIPPGKSTVVATLQGDNGYSYEYYFYSGPLGAKHDTGHVYELPCADDFGPLEIWQGYNDESGSHNGASGYAIDFGLDLGDPVWTARAGKVIGIDDTNVDACPYGDCPANYVNVLHSDGTVGGYVHVDTSSAVVAVGDILSAGTYIADSGNNGDSTGPHLHFEVTLELDNDGEGYKSVPTKFNTASGVVDELLVDHSYSKP